MSAQTGDAGPTGGRNLDADHGGQQLAKAPPSLIRNPLGEPPMRRVQADTTAASFDELRRRAAEGDTEALAELNRRGGGSA